MRDEHSLDDPLLGDLFAELRSWGEDPAPAPSEALATLLAADDITPLAGPLPAPRPRRKRMLVSKLAALGLAAKGALGVGVAAAAVTTLGVTGVLPDSAQHVVATAVEAVTPLQLPDPLSTTTTTSVGSINTSAVGDAADDDDDGTGQPANHGACVSTVAKDTSLTGREHGQAVSAIARSDCGKTGSTTSTSIGTTTTSTTVAGANANRGPSTNSGPGNSANSNAGGNSGNGNGNSGNGGGNGNSGNGNSGNGGGNSGRS